MTCCQNMASSHHGIESDVAEQKDNIENSLEDDCQTSAKRPRISDSSLENAVSVTSSKFKNITVSYVTIASRMVQ